MGNGWHPGVGIGDPEGPPRRPPDPPRTFELVPLRHLVESPVDAVFALSPGDRAIVEAGASVVVGAPIAERLRDPRLEDKIVTLQPVRATPGRPLARPRPGRRDRHRELRPGAARRRVPFPTAGHAGASPPATSWTRSRRRWRVSSATCVRALRSRSGPPGAGSAASWSLVGPTRGRLSLTTKPDGGLRPGGLDVGMAGSILVVDARVDAETLTRARAMGVRGIVVPGLASKERRDFLASEARQRAALHRLPPYPIGRPGAVRRARVAGSPHARHPGH